MTTLVWNQIGERFYELGVDRGVFYPRVGPGVAWNGLVSVNEAAAPEATRSVYLDGQKLIDLVDFADFKAEVTAFSAPEEFRVSDGMFDLAQGLFITQQPRVPFGFSWRSLIRNEFDIVGYKIHLVYNAFASPAERAHQTKSSAVDPLELKWTLDTIPPRSLTHRPTAHLVVDSTKFAADKIEDLEDVLYGTVSTTPSLPTQATVETLLGGP